MGEKKPDSPYVALIKTILKTNGFRCRGNICTPKKIGELEVEISFRNQWGSPLHDIGLLVKERSIGWLLVTDLYPFFQGFVDLFADFREHELRNLDRDSGERIRSIFNEEIIPSALEFTQQTEFLKAIEAGQFAKVGLLMPAVAKLKAKANWHGLRTLDL